MKKKTLLILLTFIICIFIVLFFFLSSNKKEKLKVEKNLMIDLTNNTISFNDSFLKKNEFSINVSYDFSDTIQKDKVISQSIIKGTELKGKETLDLVVSLGKLDLEKLKRDNINELGNVPIMMYHGIVNKKSSETLYTGGNVDKDGYNRTTEAFREDLEFYYKNGYRMIKLSDYINGNINVPYGYSPIVITFDDGNENNLKVNGLDKNGDIIIDENSAVGILESFKKKYPDYNVTAIFFVNGGLFHQPKYNDKILRWLVNNGYEVGNHTYNHDNLSKTSIEQTQKTIALVNQKLDEIIPNKYAKIIALPFGTPYSKTHSNFPYILNGTYGNYTYHMDAALRVGWEPVVSSLSIKFDKTYLKRCRAYDHNGTEFDIKMVFNMLKSSRYISDGYNDIITIPANNEGDLIQTNKKIVKY